MNIKYDLYASNDFTQFEFVSNGPNGDIIKLIQFTETDNKSLYQLSFGNKTEDGGADYLAISDNKDRDKIINTIIDAIDLFTNRYPFLYVGFSGTTPARTRLYRMVISLTHSKSNINFDVWGINFKHSNKLQTFEPGKDYDIFIIKKKSSKFEL